MSEVKVITLQDTIERELVKENVTEKVIAELKEQYGGMTLKSIDDKEGYLEIKAAVKHIRSVEILAEKICKAGREESIAIQKLWISKEKEILSKTGEFKNPLQSEVDKFDAEVERKQKEEAERKAALFINRQAELSKMGATYIGGCFVLGDVSFESNLIKDSDDDIYNETILPKYVAVFQKIESVRLEEERQKKEREDLLKKQMEEFEKQKEDLRIAQEKLKEQQEEENRRERNRINELMNVRAAVLSNLGMKYNGAEYFYGDDLTIPIAEAARMDESKWVELLQETTLEITRLKEAEAKIKELEKIESDKRLEEQKEKELREKIAQEKRLELIKQQQEEQRKADELAQSNDKTKWDDILTQLNSITLHEMNSGIYKKKLSILKEKVEEINNL